MLSSLKVIYTLAKPAEIHSLGVLERINSKPTDEVKFAFVNMGVLIHESQPNFFRDFDLTDFSLLIILLDELFYVLFKKYSGG